MAFAFAILGCIVWERTLKKGSETHQNDTELYAPRAPAICSVCIVVVVVFFVHCGRWWRFFVHNTKHFEPV